MIPGGLRSAIALPLLFSMALGLSGCGGPAARQARHEKKGQEYLAAGNLEKARLEFRNALQIAPNSSQLRYENGLVAERSTNIREAAKFFIGAIDVGPDNVAARAHLGNLYVIAGLPDQALLQVNPGLAKHPDSVELLTVHAAALAEKKDRKTALQEAQRAFSLDPNSEDAVATLAGIETADGQVDNALKLIEDATTRLPNSITLLRVLVQVYVSRNDPAGAERELLALQRLQPGEKLYRLQLAQLYAKTDRADDAERTLRKGIAEIPQNQELKDHLIEFLWARRGHEVAEAQIKQMIAAAPKDYELRLTLARFYEQNNDLPRAQAQYRDVIDQQGKSPFGMRARDRLAALYTAKNDASGAEKLINEVLDQNPGDNDALVLRAGEELSRGRPDAAITDLRRVLRDQPNSLEALLALVRAYVADGEPQLAEDSARHAVEADPSSVPARVELARALVRTGKFDPARTLLNALDKQRPDDPTVLDLLYRSSIALNDVEAARAAATQLVKIRPNAALGQVYLGILEETAGRKNEALVDYRKALELQPGAFEPLHALVLLLQREKRFDEAVAVLDEVIAHNPTSPVAPNLKGQVLLAQGNHLPQAEAAFRVALQRAPKWWDPYNGLVSVEFIRQDVDGAVKLLREAAAHSELAEAQRLDLAGLLAAAGQPEEAMTQYETVLKVNPKSPVAAGGLAMLLVSYRTDDVSLTRATNLVRPLGNSDDWRLLDAFGWVHLKNRDVTAALPALEKASAQRPDASELRFHLGMAQLKAGQTDQAEKSLSAAIEPGTHFLGRDEAKAVLAQLRSRQPS